MGKGFLKHFTYIISPLFCLQVTCLEINLILLFSQLMRFLYPKYILESHVDRGVILESVEMLCLMWIGV